MKGTRKYAYVYGGTAAFGGQVRVLGGTAWSLGRCDEVQLRATAVRDVSRTEGVRIGDITITDFWYSEIIDEDDRGEARDIDPFRPHGVPEDRSGDIDPFRPGDI